MSSNSNPQPSPLLANANSFLDIWKLPVETHSLVRIADGVSSIGKSVPSLRPTAHAAPALHALARSARSIYCSRASITPPTGWRAQLSNGSEDLAWCDAESRNFLFAFDVQQAIDDFFSEQYRTLDASAERTGSLRKLYYRLRPFMPRPLQMALRRRYARTQQLISFPAWPIEDSLMFLLRLMLWCVARAGGSDEIPYLSFWPNGARCCVSLTHDVEQSVGVNNIPAVAAIEKKHGFRSIWNFVPERYPFDPSILRQLQDDGFEIGVHGLTHDGRLFESRSTFEKRAPRINEYGRKWNAVGFRSPATLRIHSWIAENTLEFQYDSSFPDTDPYQPMPGGCCSVLPYFIGNKVELPVSMPQDHVLFETLKDESTARWRAKFDYIAAQGGLATLIVHPDYVVDPKRLRLYEEFVEFLATQKDIWFALPSQVAEWWRLRHRATIVHDGTKSRIIGTDSSRWGSPTISTAMIDPADPGSISLFARRSAQIV